MNDTKEHIIKASLLLFLQKSYRDVTMKEIVEKTGLSKGAFYHYFASKEELFKEITRVFFTMGAINYKAFSSDSLHAFYNDYLQHIGNSFQQINSLLIDSSEGEVSFNFFLIMFEAVSRFPEFLKLELEQYNREVESWKKMISKALESGEIKSQSTETELANLFLFCTDGVFLRFVNSEKKSTYKEDLRIAFDTVYTNLKA